MDALFKGEKYVAIHLRTGIDWVSALYSVPSKFAQQMKMGQKEFEENRIRK